MRKVTYAKTFVTSLITPAHLFLVACFISINQTGNHFMNPEKSEKICSAEVKKEKPDTDAQSIREKKWFHEASRTESDALRAMIGKEKQTLR